MIKVSIDKRTNIPDVPKDFEKSFSVIPDKLIKRIKQIFKEAFERITITDEMLEKYPFLADKKKFFDDYINCLRTRVDFKDTSISLEFSSEKAKSLNLPHNIHEMLEYGTKEFPACPHFRVLLTELETVTILEAV